MKFELTNLGYVTSSRRGSSLFQSLSTSSTITTTHFTVGKSTLQRLEVESASRYVKKIKSHYKANCSLQVIWDGSSVGLAHDFNIVQGIFSMRDDDLQAVETTSGLVVMIPQVHFYKS